jgi:hypothetical protein
VPQQTDPESENSGYDADYSGGCHVTSCGIYSLQHGDKVRFVASSPCLLARDF